MIVSMKPSWALAAGLAVVVVACSWSPMGDLSQPAVVRSLVAAAPMGTKLTVEHVGRERVGGLTDRWEWTVTGVSADVTMAAYSTWCEEHGLTPQPSKDVGMSCGGIDLVFQSDEAVWGSIEDDNPLIR
jgi:hypothetical protein